MANSLYSKGYFSNGILFIDTYPIADCDYVFAGELTEDGETFIPHFEVEEYIGGQWVTLDYEEGEYTYIFVTDPNEPPRLQITVKHATGKLYRVKYLMDAGENCDNCGCLSNSVCKAYVDTDELREVVLRLAGNMCTEACDIPYNLINKILELSSIELAAAKENNCSMVAKLYDKYLLNINSTNTSNCGCHG